MHFRRSAPFFLLLVWATLHPTLGYAQTSPQDLLDHRVVLRFQDQAQVTCNPLQGCSSPNTKIQTTLLQDLISQGTSVSSCYGLSPSALRATMQRAALRSKRTPPDLTQCFFLDLPQHLSPSKVRDDLLQQRGVLTAYLAPRFVPRPDLPPPPGQDPTPDFSAEQWYLDPPSAEGHGFRDAWQTLDTMGEGVRVVDIEADFNTTHEDLTNAQGSMDWAGAGTPLYQTFDLTQHATGAFGMILAQHNGFGVDGLAPDAEPIFVSEYTREYRWGVASSLMRATQHLSPGDVVLIEAQTNGPRYVNDGSQSQFGLIPVEWYQAEYDAIRVATDLGILVVEPAGNGEQDLDDPVYVGLFNRETRDSGAILVCAGNPPTGRYGPTGQAMSYTNYGSRCDIQASGADLASTGYGDLFAPNRDEDRYYTAQYGGTSGASPLVTGALVLLQAYARSSERYLSPQQARALLQDTGRTPPAGPFVGNVLNASAAALDVDTYLVPIDQTPDPNEPPAFGQRCEDACQGDFVCSEVLPGESYCLDLCDPFADVEDAICANRNLVCELQVNGEGICAAPRGDGLEGEACEAYEDCANNLYCNENFVCASFCSVSQNTGCTNPDATCLEFGGNYGDLGFCFVDESNPDGEEDGGPCVENSDCQGGYCIAQWYEGYCSDLFCDTDDDCNGSASACIPIDNEGNTACFAQCRFNADCRDGYTCQDGYCLEGEVESCETNTDCPRRQRCEDNACVPSDGGGTNNGTSGTGGTSNTGTSNTATSSTNNATNGTTNTDTSNSGTTNNGTTSSTNGPNTGGFIQPPSNSNSSSCNVSPPAQTPTDPLAFFAIFALGLLIRRRSCPPQTA